MQEWGAWVSWLLGASAVVVAFGVLVQKVFKPAVKLASKAEQLAPLMDELLVKFRDVPEVFTILKEVVEQVRTDSGSSLKDMVIELTKSAEENRAAAEVLKVGVLAAKELSERDRQEMQRLILDVALMREAVRYLEERS